MLGRAVDAAVIDEDHLRVAVEPVQEADEAPLQLGQRLLLVEDRDDERVAWALGHAPPMVDEAPHIIGARCS